MPSETWPPKTYSEQDVQATPELQFYVPKDPTRWSFSTIDMDAAGLKKFDDDHLAVTADVVRSLITLLDPDPLRPGLVDTPVRVAKAWREWTCGYAMNPAEVLKTFDEGDDVAAKANEMVIVHNVPIISKCEHHMADIVGHAHIGYIPGSTIVGLSKLARLAEVYSRRLQVQERMTNQIADALVEHLKPVGVGVLIRAAHGCMSTRGVRIHGSTTTTSALRGVLRTEFSARQEFLTLCQMAEAAKP